MDRKKSVLKTALLASGSFAGYNIGSGFATGAEGQQFFAAWGSPRAFWGVLTAMLVTALIFIPVYLAAYRRREDRSYNIYHYYCGETLGRLIDWYMYLSILLIILTMMSGAGATIRQFLGIPELVGAGVLCALCIAAALLGLERLMHLLSYAGVVIVAFVLCCTAYLRFGLGVRLTLPTQTFDALAEEGSLLRVGILGFSSPMICGAASAGLLIVSSLPWVASTGSLCESRKSALWSGALSGLLFYAAQSVVVYLNLISMDKIAGEEVPVLAVFQSFLPVLAPVYSCLIILAIFSTVSGRLFLFASRFDGGSRKRHIFITVLTAVLAALGGSCIPFSALSNFMFTVNGCLGILLALAVLLRTLRDALKRA